MRRTNHSHIGTKNGVYYQLLPLDEYDNLIITCCSWCDVCVNGLKCLASGFEMGSGGAYKFGGYWKEVGYK